MEPGNLLDDLIKQYTSHITILKERSSLRGAPLHYSEEWNEVEGVVEKLEVQVDRIRKKLQEDFRGELALTALKERLLVEKAELEALEACMPTRATNVLFENAGQQPLRDSSRNSESASLDAPSEQQLNVPQKQPSKPGSTNRKRPVTAEEMNGLPSHVRSRETEAKVNKLLEELFKAAESNQSLFKKSSHQLNEDQKAKQKVLLSLSSKEQKGKLLVFDSELKGGASAKQGYIILKTLGRLAEVRGVKGTRLWELL